MCQEENLQEVEKLWKLVDAIHQTCPELKRIDYDRRTVYAAGLTIEAWKYLQALYSAASRPTESIPPYLVTLESYLNSIPAPERKWWMKKRKREDDLLTSNEASKGDHATLMLGSDATELFPDISMTFEDIDWAFWSMPGGEEMMSGFNIDALGAEWT